MMLSKRGLRACLIACGGVAAIIAACILIKPRASTAGPRVMVPLELVLLVDTSGSVDEQEYQLQQDGYVEAFRDEEITQQIEDMGGIAVVYIEWDDVDNQTVCIPWTRLRSRSDCLGFANAVQAIDRQTSGTTMIAPALAFAKNQLLTNDYMGMRRVIDVSGDGLCKNWRFFELGILDNGHDDPAHYGTPWASTIAGLGGAVDSVNGVFIGPVDENLDFYRDVLPFGNDAFSMHAEGFEEFADTVKDKIMREVSVPIPGTFD